MTTPVNPQRPSFGERDRGASPLQIDAFPVRAHYDQDDAVFSSMLDPRTRMYSCALFERGDESLEKAQLAMNKHLLDKLNLQPGQRLLDVGFGWGGLPLYAKHNYGVDVIALTISQKQVDYVQKKFGQQPGVDFRLQGWEEFQEPVDAVVSKGAFEHFGEAKYRSFFEQMYSILPENRLMVLHSIVRNPEKEAELDRRNRVLFGRHLKFLGTDIFPQGYLPTPDTIITLSREAGFTLVGEERVGKNYAPTLEHWRQNLVKNREAFIAATDEVKYQMYEGQYLTGTQEWFVQGSLDVGQYLLRTKTQGTRFIKSHEQDCTSCL